MLFLVYAGKKGAAPPLVPENEAEGRKTLAGCFEKLRKEYRKKRRNGVIETASKRAGLNGLPDMEADQSRSEMGCAVHSVSRDSSVQNNPNKRQNDVERR